MKKSVIINTLLIIFLTLLLFSCEETIDYYIGINQQPELTEDTFEEGLNIFGLLRPDHRDDFNKSFVFVQQNWPALEFDNFNIIHNTDISVYRLENGEIIDSISFPLMPSDSLFGDTLYRPEELFQPEPGEHYQITCDHPDFPVAVGETYIPSVAVIDSSTLIVNGNTVEFEVLSDTLIKMMDVYLVSETGGRQTGRYVPVEGENTLIRVDIPPESPSVIIKIFSYDNKLATYYANANTSLNFNKYRTTFSTLESGFGVFGSMNFVELEVTRN